MRELMVHAYAHEHVRMVKRDVLRPAGMMLAPCPSDSGSGRSRSILISEKSASRLNF
jgi:hypothetical protein